MRAFRVASLCVCVALLTALAVRGQSPAPESAPEPTPEPKVVERGKFLVMIGGCGDCHTPKKMGAQGPEPDPTRLLSGHPQDEVVTAPPALGGSWIAATNGNLTAWAGPWGISYATNLTPEETTGMKIWTQEMFVSAMRTGRHFGQSRPILPPMPWQSLAQLSDADLAAIYTYLRAIPPVKNLVPDPVLAEPPAEPGS